MSDEQPTVDDAAARITKALGLLDIWLHDESDSDGIARRMMWDNVREVRAALTGERRDQHHERR